MKDFYKYLQVSQDYLFRELVVVNAGHTMIPPGSDYPATSHPSHHYFRFTQGRVIDEYQLIYISNGGGMLETESAGRLEITAGDVILLFPGEWHRYRPDEKTGWTENWVGFTGDASLLNVSGDLVSRVNPVFSIGVDDRVMSLFFNILELVKLDQTGSEYAISGATLNLIGYLLCQKKRLERRISNRNDEIITRAKTIMECQFDQKVNLEEIAGQLHISYVWFRTYFRKHTGFSPYDYLLNIRINHASLLLANSNLSIKEIALASGFHSQQQFSKTFRKKTGVSPREYKRHFLNGRHADRSRFEFSQ